MLTDGGKRKVQIESTAELFLELIEIHGTISGKVRLNELGKGC
jgi:hypothetical protein